METSVVIVNWNGARLLPACLTALATQTYRDYDLWLVDNGSIDESLGMLHDLDRSSQPDWLPVALPARAHVIFNERNLGFAYGNNQAMRLTGATYVVALNNDAIAEPTWLEELVRLAGQGGPRVGMVASTMLFANRPQVVASAGITVHRDGVALDRAVGMLSRRLEEGGTRPVFGPSAGAALYSADLLRDVGLLDVRFFSYLEDADLAWRARSRGWRAVHNPRARVLHEYSATGGHDSPFKRNLISRNRVWLLYKNMPGVLLQRFAPQIARYELGAFLFAIASGDRHLVRGRLQAMSRLGEFTRDRRMITTSARVHPDEMATMLAPALSARQTLKFRRRLTLLLSRV